MSSEETEWKLWDKRINHSKTIDELKRPRRRINIPIEDGEEQKFFDVVHLGKNFTWTFPLQEGLLITDEMVDVHFYATDGEID